MGEMATEEEGDTCSGIFWLGERGFWIVVK